LLSSRIHPSLWHLSSSLPYLFLLQQPLYTWTTLYL
jgi:hypothetical protein